MNHSVFAINVRGLVSSPQSLQQSRVDVSRATGRVSPLEFTVNERIEVVELKA
ncbi:hypothetical protein AWB79_04456 [Caballeronia hypogeia]|uniref:Uncharacterized protein n=1 Tax=Caballeronia hypogeia TaxID=1777140 RepID=A0A158BZJ7_9BURK|nr:hypothetical protein AWB79_04456 [Caballeronia hypogeia]